MRRLIVYASQHGCTEEVAQKLKKYWKEVSVLVNMKYIKNIDLNLYDQVVVGGSIHAGQIQKSINGFCEANRETLLSKPLGLFLCCMEEKKAQAQFDAAYDVALRRHALATGVLGGAFNFSRMNFLERFIVKKVSGVTESVKKWDEAAIRAFAEAMMR